ncbi:unnamed protein product [Notodromas monacha]|uniref:Uncharacterized protein n=1 Tax=Notodromas monacha TaxID=399045 RepID=A0A7R9BLC1_9CRUS|nr:unnamed protein product [Notodromas monacha]CAG0916242.1 unnamed protein product [Notodromas monacha]
MSRTCILVVGLPLGACLCFVVYAIFVVPALEPGLRDGVDLMGGHHLQGREYLYLVYWACAGTLITLAACLGLTRLCRCQVKDFADEYATGGGGGASSSSSSSPAGRGTLLRGGHHQPVNLLFLATSSLSSGKQQQSVKLPSFIAAASGLSSSPSSPAAPSSALALTRTLTVQPSTNPGFVFDDDDDDNDDDDDGLPTTIRSLEEKLAAARVWPNTYSGTAGMGQRWRSMPFERGFSLAWDDDLGFDDLKLGDEPLTPEVDASISEKLRTIQTRSASKTNFVPDTPTTTDDGVVVEEADLFPSSSSSSSTHPPPSFLTTMTSSHIDLFPDTCSSSTSTTTGNKQ